MAHFSHRPVFEVFYHYRCQSGPFTQSALRRCSAEGVIVSPRDATSQIFHQDTETTGHSAWNDGHNE